MNDKLCIGLETQEEGEEDWNRNDIDNVLEFIRLFRLFQGQNLCFDLVGWGWVRGGREVAAQNKTIGDIEKESIKQLFFKTKKSWRDDEDMKKWRKKPPCLFFEKIKLQQGDGGRRARGSRRQSRPSHPSAEEGNLWNGSLGGLPATAAGTAQATIAAQAASTDLWLRCATVVLHVECQQIPNIHKHWQELYGNHFFFVFFRMLVIVSRIPFFGFHQDVQFLSPALHQRPHRLWHPRGRWSRNYDRLCDRLCDQRSQHLHVSWF